MRLVSFIHWKRTLANIFLALAACLFIVPVQVQATGEFEADYDVQYAISQTGKTIVTQHVSLTNKLSNYYPKQYSLLIDSDKISNVIAYDDGGIITPTISVKDGKTEITLKFNVKAIGLGKSSSFSLRYEHSGVASQNGSIWEVYVPGITNDPDIGSYDVTLAVPPTFGPAAYLSPQPHNGKTWNKEQMIRGGISGAYGDSQNFAVTLTYSLANTSMVPRLTDIALPPDTAFQKITMDSLSPKPETITKDVDGNWLARYKLLPAQTETVTAKINVSVFLSPIKNFQQPVKTMTDYLQARDYWQVNDPKIQALAKQYTTPEQIYNYVANNLKYDTSRVSATTTRMGAVQALATPNQAVCQEFTDLFIAIARAAGIPARRDVGYAYTTNPKLRPLSFSQDILHAWPEYYDADQQIWIPIDPTWANTTGGTDYFTKLDFNHIVFATNGMDSSLPYPAGFYHSSDAPSKDISVVFAPTKARVIPADITSRIEFPKQVGAGTRATGAIVVTNKGGESAYGISVTATSDIGNMNASTVIPVLLPYANMEVPLIGVMPQTFQSKAGSIRATVNDTQLTYGFTVQPLYWLIALASLFGISSIIVAIKLSQLIIWKFFRNH